MRKYGYLLTLCKYILILKYYFRENNCLGSSLFVLGMDYSNHLFLTQKE